MGVGSQVHAHYVPLAPAFTPSPSIFQAMMEHFLKMPLSTQYAGNLLVFRQAGISGEQRALYAKTVWPHLCTSKTRSQFMKASISSCSYDIALIWKYKEAHVIHILYRVSQRNRKIKTNPRELSGINSILLSMGRAEVAARHGDQLLREHPRHPPAP